MSLELIRLPFFYFTDFITLQTFNYLDYPHPLFGCFFGGDII